MTSLQDKLDYIASQDPASMERLKRLLDKKSFLLDKNIYGEQFTDRQFNLVFDPLLRTALDRARILELLAEKDNTIPALSGRLSMETWRVFDYLKDLLKNNLVEIVGYEERNPLFKRR